MSSSAAPRDKQLQQEEKLQRRATQLAGVIKRFLGEYRQLVLPNPATAAAAGTAAAQTGAGVAAAGAGKGKPAAAAAAAKGKPAGTGDKGKGDAGKGAAKDPRAAAWALFLGELDDRINKSKRCGLEDVYRAVDTLPLLEQQVLHQIITITSSALLPQAMNEASAAVKDMLFSAACAAHLSHPQQQLPTGTITAASSSSRSSSNGAVLCRERGFSAQEAYEAGYSIAQLLSAGYSLAEVAATSAPLRQLRAAGVGISDLVTTGLADTLQLSGVEGARKLREAGYTYKMIVDSQALSDRIGPWDLKLAGLQPVQLAHKPPPPPPQVVAPTAAAAGGGVVGGGGGVVDGTATAATEAAEGSSDTEPQQPSSKPAAPPPAPVAAAAAAVEPPGISGEGAKDGLAGILQGTPEELRYFRKGVKGVMQLAAGRGLHAAVLGTTQVRRPASARAAAAATSSSHGPGDQPPPTCRGPGPKNRRASWVALAAVGAAATTGAGGGRNSSGGVPSRPSSGGTSSGGAAAGGGGGGGGGAGALGGMSSSSGSGGQAGQGVPNTPVGQWNLPGKGSSKRPSGVLNALAK